MPRGDRTGPEGMGPGTGRGAGPCGGNQGQGGVNPPSGRGLGKRGRGRGWRNWFGITGLPRWMRFGSGGDEPPQGKNRS